MRPRVLVALLIIFTASTRLLPAQDFVLRDGDTVVFMGDSITAAQTYGKIIENYTLLRFPDRRIRFINAGKGGETAQDGLKRLQRDVFDKKATVLTVAFGVNDIGWGMRADDKHRQQYLDAISGIVTSCKEKGVRVYICSAALTGADPHKSETDFLQKMCDEGMAISKSLGGNAIDVQRTMREISKRIWDSNAQTTDPKSKSTLHEPDTIHLNETGQIAMAYAILKGLDAPAEVSSATLNASNPSEISQSNCTITDVKQTSTGLAFVRLDKGWPLNLGLIGHLANRWVPLQQDLGRYMLTVRSLPEAKYIVTVGGRKLGAYTATQLAEGVNLGSATPDPWEPGGPWDVQATLVRELTDARANIGQSQRLNLYFSSAISADPTYISDSNKLIESIESLQRKTARPFPVRFVIARE